MTGPKKLDRCRIRSRPKRAPPTIDLEATEVSERSHRADRAACSRAACSRACGRAHCCAEPEPKPESSRARGRACAEAPPPAPRPVSPWIIAPVSGAVAAALVIGVGWMLGWPAVQPASAPPAPQLNAAAIDDLTARIAGVEVKGRPAPAADPAAAARIEALEKSLAALRGELAATRAQGDKLAAAVNEVKSAPRGDGPASPDLAGDQRAHRQDREPDAGAGRRDRAARQQDRGHPMRPRPSPPTTCRCAAWWRRPCSMCWFGSAIPIRRRLRRRNRWRPIRTR